MQLNLVRGRSRLTMRKVEHAHTRNLHGNVCRLEAGGGGELRVKLGARVGNVRQERAGRPDARGCRDLRDHGIAGCILNHEMVVGVALQLEQGQGCIDDPCRGPGSVPVLTDSRSTPHCERRAEGKTKQAAATSKKTRRNLNIIGRSCKI